MMSTKERLKVKAETERAERVTKDFYSSLKTWQDLFRDKTDEELEALAEGRVKPAHETAQEELFKLLDEEAEQMKGAAAQKSGKRGAKKKDTNQNGPQKEEDLKKESAPKPLPVVVPKLVSLSPEDLALINTMANRYHDFLAGRVTKWGGLSPELIKKIPGYGRLSNDQALELQAKHYLKGVHALVNNEELRVTYTFPSCYIDGKGNKLFGIGILAALHYNGSVQIGVVYIGCDKTTGKIYHAFLETEHNHKRQSIDDLLRPKIYQHFQSAQERASKHKEDEGWMFTSCTTFEKIEKEEAALKMTQADSSGNEQLFYIFYPIRGTDTGDKR